MRALTVCATLIVLQMFASNARADEDQNRLLAEQAQFYNDEPRLAGTCADVAELRRRAGTVGPSTSKLYLSAAEARRAAGVASLKEALGAFMREADKWRTPYFAAGDTPDGVRQDSTDRSPATLIAEVRATIDKGRCFDADFAARATAAVNALGETVEKMIAKETSCRATPACLGLRIAAQLCATLAERRAALHDIDVERHNPGGVVDVVKLHDLGLNVQTFDASIAAWRAQYASTMHKPFSERACSK